MLALGARDADSNSAGTINPYFDSLASLCSHMENFDEELNRGVPSATEGIVTPYRNIGTETYNPDFGQRKTVNKHNHDARNFKCPKCNGEFNNWDHGNAGDEDTCPFCGLERGSYEPL